ncbi:MAG: M17 family peptidase N-terminal domain-containing protein [Deltaproteobacteria bacterium]|nr:M17 family peptidase N-terminal domain-containing protein [Deltaproteobacteria bacterium]
MSRPKRIPASLEALDGLEADTVLLFLPSDERPPQGVTGLVDWRLAGAISRLSARGWLMGQEGELCLSPGRARLEGARLLVCGVGEEKKVSEASLQKAVTRACEALGEIGCKTLACGLPAFGKDPAGLGASVERTLKANWSGPLTLLEPKKRAG